MTQAQASIYQQRPEITLPEGPPCDILRLTGFESVSGLFRFDVDITPQSETAYQYGDLTSDDCVGRLAQITLQSAGQSERVISGVISRFSVIPVEDDGLPYAYRVRLVPWLELLKHASTCRVFEDMTMEDILQRLFSDIQLPGQAYRFDTHDPLPILDTCLQFQETDLNFVMRQLERHGVFFYFEQSADTHTLVMADKNSDFLALAGSARASYGQSVTHWRMDHALHTGAVTMADFDYRSAQEISETETTLVEIGPNGDLKHQCFPGGFNDADTARQRTRIAIQREENGHRVFSGRSTRPDFAAGSRFELQGHPDPAMNESYLLTRVDHAFDNVHGMRNHFQCIRDEPSMAFRPPQTAARPTVSGPQTALVTDRDDPDDLGRVRVRFPWGSDNNECWVRLSQLMAGRDHGTWFVPAEGDEVVVDFMNGDPDRPIVTGRVYNGNRSPFERDPEIHAVRSRHGQQIVFDSERVVIENNEGSRIELKNDGAIHVVSSAGTTLEISSSGAVTLTGSSSVDIQASTIGLTAGQVTVDSAMARFSGVVQCNTLIATSVVSSSYTPGAGNIW